MSSSMKSWLDAQNVPARAKKAILEDGRFRPFAVRVSMGRKGEDVGLAFDVYDPTGRCTPGWATVTNAICEIVTTELASMPAAIYDSFEAFARILPDAVCLFQIDVWVTIVNDNDDWRKCSAEFQTNAAIPHMWMTLKPLVDAAVRTRDATQRLVCDL